MKGIALICRRPIHPLAAALLATMIGVALWGGNSQSIVVRTDRPQTLPITIQPVANPTSLLPARTQQTILVASFNIQAFGQSKVDNPWVLERLAAVIRQFDVVAIQEVRSKDAGTLPRLLQAINQTGVQYQFLIGPRLGRTSSQEQYAYVYDSSRIIASPQATYTVLDGKPTGSTTQEVGIAGQPDLLHREPFVARFVVKTLPQPFRFTMANVHTDPDEVKSEMDVLSNVWNGVRAFERLQANEDDLLMVGDFNADPPRFGKLGQIAGIQPTISGIPTNVRGTNLYDNIMHDAAATREYTGRSGVLSLMQYFGLSVDDALKLSDPHPIWAAYSAFEAPGPGAPQTIASDPYGSTLR
jgi:endonuclease/exonuclease/phosphatase family metal-dependent hydrolase